jgi:hypothetical protein
VKGKRINVTESPRPRKKGIADDGLLDFEEELIRTADEFTLINMRLRRGAPGYRNEASSLEEAEMLAAKIFASNPTLQSLTMYATRGARFAQVATVFPAGTTKLPNLPGRAKTESRQWIVGGQGWGR